jgi:hypothetical protein
MLLADSWYTSGTFWGAAGALAVLLTCGIATWVAFSLANPVRRLLCVMSAAPLLHAPAQGMQGRLQITWNGTELEDPSVLDISLTNRGRRDISRDDFDQPLEFRVQAQILAVLATTTKPDKTTFSAISFEDDVLKVGPGLIRRHQTIKFTLLAIGAAPTLTSSATALREVDVVLATDQAGGGAAPRRVRAAVALAATAAVAGVLLIGLLIGHAFLPRVNQSSLIRPPMSSAHATSSATAKASVAAKASAPAMTSAPATTSAPVSPQVSNSVRMGEADLTSGQAATQLGGIDLLQSVMKAGPAEQPTVLQSLAKFIQARSPSGNNDQPITSVIQAAVNVLRSRDPADDDGAVIDLTNANLTNANLTGIDLDNAILVNADFDSAVLTNANLKDANLNYAYLGDATLAGANLTGANLADASLYQTTLCNGSTPTAPQRGYTCSSG